MLTKCIYYENVKCDKSLPCEGCEEWAKHMKDNCNHEHFHEGATGAFVCDDCGETAGA